jgi:hypothetical protein
MSIVELFPYPRVLSSTLNDNQNDIPIVHKHSISSNYECNCSLMTDETDSSSNSNNNDDNDGNKSNYQSCLNSRHSLTVNYGPINVKVRQYAAPTLETGRRSKFSKLEGDAAIKRELRRKRNREAAQKLKIKRCKIEQQLEKEINELEFKEQDLLTKVDTLKSYKHHLEVQQQRLILIKDRLTLTESSTLLDTDRNRLHIHRSLPSYRDRLPIKNEPRSPSPQWQLLFSI